MLKLKLKSAWKSWTIRVNAIFAAVLGGLPFLQDAFPALQPYMDAEHYKYAMGTIVAINILLRFKTSAALEHK